MKYRFYRFMVAKTYFDTGYGLTGYFKYLVAFLGFTGYVGEILSYTQVILIGLGYGVACYILGRLWYRYRLPEVSAYIDNKFDPFVADVKEKLGMKHDRKI